MGFYANISDDTTKVVPWAECHISEVACADSYKIRYVDIYGRTQAKIVAGYDLAEARPFRRNELVSRGVRVIAQRDPKKLPTSHESSASQDIFLINKSGFYLGFTGEQCTINGVLHSMIFFDDGHVQYIPMNKIRGTLRNDMCAHANANVHQFYDYYMAVMDIGEMVKTFQIQKPAVDDFIRIDLQCYWEKARVLAVDDELIKVFFTRSERTEWIWIGSPRLNRVWNALVWHGKMHQNTVSTECDYKTIDSSDSHDDAGKQKLFNASSQQDLKAYIESLPSRRKVQHRCTGNCVLLEESLDLSKHQALVRPMLTGWKRRSRNNQIFYITPCGLILDQYASIGEFLRKTSSSLSFECFAFNINVDCFKEFEAGEKVLFEVSDRHILGIFLFPTSFHGIIIINFVRVLIRISQTAKKRSPFEWSATTSAHTHRISNTSPATPLIRLLCRHTTGNHIGKCAVIATTAARTGPNVPASSLPINNTLPRTDWSVQAAWLAMIMAIYTTLYRQAFSNVIPAARAK